MLLLNSGRFSRSLKIGNALKIAFASSPARYCTYSSPVRPVNAMEPVL
ncbi:hypothetical protein [Lysobacter gummosus]